MVEAAYRVFVEDGFGTATMNRVAREAGVAVQTLYFSFRTKGDLLQAAFEYAVLGPDATPPHASNWWRTAEEEPDIVRALEVWIAGTMPVFERAAPLVWAVLGDTNARERYEYNEGLRRAGYRRMLDVLLTKHPLRSGLNPQRALDILLVVLGPQVFRQLTYDLDWSTDEVHVWARDLLLDQLFGLNSSGSSPRDRRRHQVQGSH
jgi:AcrR family transcriptional regulator